MSQLLRLLRSVRAQRRRFGFMALAGVASGLLGLAGFAAASTVVVKLTSTGPQPPKVTVAVGDTVSFIGADNQNHSIISKTGGFTSPVIKPGETWSRVMDAPGRFRYRETNFGKPNRGLIVVQVVGALELSASPSSVVYGREVVLSGRSPLPGRQVTLSWRSAGKHAKSAGGGWSELATVAADGAGAFSLTIQPKISGKYRAAVAAGRKKLTSSVISVMVKPLLTAAPLLRTARTGTVLRITGRVTPPTAANTVALMRFDRGLRRWKQLAETQVRAGGTAVFAWSVVRGRSLLRLEILRSGREPGFDVAASNRIVITGVGPAPSTGQKGSKTRRQSVSVGYGYDG